MKQRADWERIEAEFRVGILSIKEIARQHGISDAAIHKRAKAGGWDRDLSAKVKTKVKALLVSVPKVCAEEGKSKPQTEREVVDATAAGVAGVVRGHRRDISSRITLTQTLHEQLADAVGNRDALADAIVAVTADDQSDRRAQALAKAIALPVHINAMKDLAAATQTLIRLERQAFGLSDGDDPAPKTPSASDDRAVEYARNDGLLDKLNAALAARSS